MRSILTASTLFCFWILLSGHSSPLLLSLGAASAATVALMARRLRNITPNPNKNQHIIKIKPLKTLKYSLWLAKQIILANLHIAKTIINPFSKIYPHTLRVSAHQKTLIGETIFANSITLTPGTISVKTEEKEILIHALTKKSGDIATLSEMGQRIQMIEK